MLFFFLFIAQCAIYFNSNLYVFSNKRSNLQKAIEHCSYLNGYVATLDSSNYKWLDNTIQCDSFIFYESRFYRLTNGLIYPLNGQEDLCIACIIE